MSVGLRSATLLIDVPVRRDQGMVRNPATELRYVEATHGYAWESNQGHCGPPSRDLWRPYLVTVHSTSSASHMLLRSHSGERRTQPGCSLLSFIKSCALRSAPSKCHLFPPHTPPHLGLDPPPLPATSSVPSPHWRERQKVLGPHPGTSVFALCGPHTSSL